MAVKIRKKLGVIGTGFMGTAILKGILERRILTSAQVRIYDQDGAKMRKTAKKFGVRCASSAEDLVRGADLVLLAVKPQDLERAAETFQSALKAPQTVISILAGTPIQRLRKILGDRVCLVRAMPNLGAEVGASMTVVSGASRSALQIAETLFSGCGPVMRLPEHQMDWVTAISGSGPAYYFLLTELLAEAGRRAGIPEEKAVRLAVQTARGAGLLAASSAYPPAELRRRVTSKGGTTEAALNFFNSKHLSQIILDGVRAACLRGRELNKKGDSPCLSGRQAHRDRA